MVCLVMGSLLGCAATCVAILFAPYLLHQYSPSIIEIARWLMPNLIIGIDPLIGRAALEANRSFLKSGFVLTGPPLLTLGGLTALAILHQLTPITAAVTYTLSGLPAAIYLYRQLPISFRHTWKETVNAGRTLLSYGIRSYGIDLCGTLGYYLDQALVVSLLSPDKMGIYVVALSASRVMNVPRAGTGSCTLSQHGGVISRRDWRPCETGPSRGWYPGSTSFVSHISWWPSFAADSLWPRLCYCQRRVGSSDTGGGFERMRNHHRSGLHGVGSSGCDYSAADTWPLP